MHDLLFVSDESTASVYTFRVLANGSLSQLGPAVLTQGSRPEYIATWSGFVDGMDFIAWNNHKFSASLHWDFGDFTGDGFVDGRDLIEWNLTKFTSSNATAVPKTFRMVWFLLAVGLVCGYRIRSKTNVPAKTL